ncbi:MAG: cytochrome c, partial [Bacteroidia bacterium]
HQVSLGSKGKALIDGSDCLACHKINEKLVGPSYLDVSKKYTEKDKEYLVSKIMNGGSGVWGNAPMAAHPTLKKEEVEEMVDYILSLKKEPDASLPLEGGVSFDQHKASENYGLYLVTATYTDKGNGDITPLTSQDQVVIKSPYFEAEDADDISKGASAWNAGGKRVLGSINHDQYFGFKKVKLKGLKSIDFSVFYAGKYGYAGKVIVKESGKNGSVIGEMNLNYPKNDKGNNKTYSIKVKPSNKDADLYFVFENKSDKEQFITNPDGIYLNY